MRAKASELSYKKRRFVRARRFGYAMMSPTILVLGLMTLYPMVFMIIYSFTDFRLLSRETRIVGFANYLELLKNEYFRSSVWITMKFTVISVFAELLLGFLCALYVNSIRSKKVQGVLRILLLVPYLLPTVTVTVCWRMMLSANFGIVNKWCEFWGITTHNWLSDISTAFGTLLVVEIWQDAPFVFLLLYVALRAIPEEQFEAAEVFGARPVDLFKMIILPNLQPSIMFCIMMRSIDCIRLFDKVNLLTGGGPANSTTTISQFVYHYGIRNLRFGYGSAACLVITLVVLLITGIYVKRRQLNQPGRKRENALTPHT